MEPLLHSETFFYISSFCLVFITLLLIVLFIYLISIARVVYDVMKIVRKKAKQMSLKLDNIEANIEDSNIVHWLSFLLSRKKKAKTKTKKPEKE